MSRGVSCISTVFGLLLAATAAADQGLVGHYTFDEGCGQVAKDHSGNGNHGRIVGAIFVDSPLGDATVIVRSILNTITGNWGQPIQSRMFPR